ncbi:MAG: HEAT repeat domain-containing protein [Pirellulales bacterium]|nr:HEAT repeat domain-containing protein [Pirellulales bacterium]
MLAFCPILGPRPCGGPNPIAKLKKLCVDEHPRVRLEAIRACSFFKGEQGGEAAEAALASLDKPQDPYLSYMMKETMKTLKPYLKK